MLFPETVYFYATKPHILFIILLIDFLFVGKCSNGVEERTPGKTYAKTGR